MPEVNFAKNHTIGGNPGKYFVLGIDTEFVGKNAAGEFVYPHQQGMSQERSASKDYDYDWHGDGFAWELCLAPSHCIDIMMGRALDGKHFLTTQGITSLFGPALYSVDNSVYAAAPEVVTRLGCARSLNIHGGIEKPILPDGVRTTGCHLHISHGDLRRDMVKPLIEWADLLVGNTWTMISPLPAEEERFRRTAYGRAGEHRYAPLDEGGIRVEYRTLPGHAAVHMPYLSMMLALYRQACRFVFDGFEAPAELVGEAAEAINNADAKIARRVYRKIAIDPYSRRIINFYRSHPDPLSGCYGFRDWFKRQRRLSSGKI